MMTMSEKIKSILKGLRPGRETEIANFDNDTRFCAVLLLTGVPPRPGFELDSLSDQLAEDPPPKTDIAPVDYPNDQTRFGDFVTTAENNRTDVTEEDAGAAADEMVPRGTVPTATFAEALEGFMEKVQWQGNQMMGIWKNRYRSLMITFITGKGGLCAAWIGPVGHGIISMTKITIPKAEPPDNVKWIPLAEGELVPDEGENIAYALDYHRDKKCLRIQPKDTQNWDPKTNVTIEITKENAKLKNESEDSNENPITLTKRTAAENE